MISSCFVRATQMSEIGAMSLCAVSNIGVCIGYGVASALKLAPQKKLLAYAASATIAHSLLTAIVASGSLTPSNRRSSKIMEAWMRRLDAFVTTGDDRTGVAGSLLTPLAVVTGSNCGLGKMSAENLAACGWKVVMACRDLKLAEAARVDVVAAAQARLAARYKHLTDATQRARAAELVASVDGNVSVSQLDVSDMASVRAFVQVLKAMEALATVSIPQGKHFTTRHDGLRLLLNNAGLFEHGYSRWSPEGVQCMFNTNYAGPSYLTHLITKEIIRPRVAKQTEVAATSSTESPAGTPTHPPTVVPFRIVGLASCANLWALGFLNPKNKTEATEMMQGILAGVGDRTQNTYNNTLLRGITGDTYGISKLGHMALAYNYAQQFAKEGVGAHLTAYAIHPGGVRTGVFRNVDAKRRAMLKIFSPIVFKGVRNGASNQTYMSLAVIEEQLSSDALTRSVGAANGWTNTIVRADVSGPLNAMVIPAATSGQFLIDAGEGKEKAVAIIANPDVYALFDAWTTKFIDNCEGVH